MGQQLNRQRVNDEAKLLGIRAEGDPVIISQKISLRSEIKAKRPFDIIRNLKVLYD